MKLIVAAIFALLAVSAFAEVEPEWEEINWATVVPRTELPGFWDERDIALKPTPEITRGGRIVGG